MNNSPSDQYIKRTSATVLALTKVLDGSLAGFALYTLFRFLAPFIDELSKGAMDLNQLLQTIVSEYGISDSLLRVYSEDMIGSVALPAVVYGGVLLLTVIALFLAIIETIALLSLRFAKTGAGFVKVIHQIYVGVCIIHVIMFVYSVFEYVKNHSVIQELLKGSGTEIASLDIALMIIAVIYLIILLMHLCYHKDIAMAMETVKSELKTGKQGYFKRTHLSGISFMFGLPYLCLILAFITGILNHKLDLSDTQLSNWISLGVIIIVMLKQYSVCFCYRNLKHSR